MFFNLRGASRRAPARTKPALPFLFVSVFLVASPVWGTDSPKDRTAFRVCADPNNLPYSNRNQEGFENKIAELLAQQMGQQVAYTWWPQRRGFLRNTLSAGVCDVVMGVPQQYDAVLTTRPYYRSSYVFLQRQNAAHKITSFDDALLRSLKIGVHLIGDDYANSPPAHLLSAKGIVDNVVGYSVFGNYAEDSPPGKLVAAVATGEVDVAIVWGPIAGYFAKKQAVPLALVPVPNANASPSLPLSYGMSVGVRRQDKELKAKLDTSLQNNASAIRRILDEYGIPLIQ